MKPATTLMLLFAAVLTAALAVARPAAAQDHDEPGLTPPSGVPDRRGAGPMDPRVGARDDEPAMVDLRLGAVREAPAAPVAAGFWYRVDLGFGWASLLHDPDVSEGYGGHAAFAFGFHPRVGAELSLQVANNPFQDTLGTIAGADFLTGNISLGAVVRISPPGGWFGGWLTTTAEAGLGTYLTKDQIRQSLMSSLGFHVGGTVSVHVWRFLAVGFKVRYHLINVARIAGEPLRDIKAFREVGVFDRFEIPVVVSAYF